MIGLDQRLRRVEERLAAYCSECHHCNPLPDEDAEVVESELRTLVEAIESTIRCEFENCSRRDDLKAL